jgi:hypothetical protein
MRSIICVVLLSSLIWSQSLALTGIPVSQTTGGTVTGTVKEGTKPVRSVTVALQRDIPGFTFFPRGGSETPPPGSGMFHAVTDERGQFVFNNVPAGDYSIGPIPEVYVLPDAASASTGIPVKVSDRQSTAPIELSVVRGGVITGKITDSGERPVIAEYVNLSRVEATGRPPRAVGGNRSEVETDDRGIYRIYGLSEGRYVLSVGSDEPGFGPQLRGRYARTWHPNVRQEAQAKLIEVSPGKVAENIDIKLGEPARTFTVEGRTIDASTGKPIPGVTVTVMQIRGQPGDQGSIGGRVGNPGVSDTLGVFSIGGLPSGNYIASVDNLFAGLRSQTSDYYSEWASFQITNGDAGGLELRLHPGISISGIVRVEGMTDSQTIAALLSNRLITARVTYQDESAVSSREVESGRYGRSNIAPDGTFRIAGLRPGRVTLFLTPVGGKLGIVRIERNGIAVPNESPTVSGEHVIDLLVVLREANSSIRGKVIVTGGTSGVIVTARPQFKTGFQPGLMDAVDQNGNFAFDGLVPGSYEVIASATGRPQMPGPQAGRPGPTVPGPEVKQMVTVTAGNVATITLTLDLSKQ